MTYDRSDFNEFVNNRKAERFPKVALELLSQSEVQTDKLTGDATWDWFLSYIASAVEKTQEVKAAFETQLHSVGLVDDNEVRRIRMEIICCQARIEAWNAVMSLPKDLRAMGTQAKGLLEH